MPLSAVCRNQAGSFEPSDFAISCLDLSSTFSGLDVSRISVESPLNGRFRDEFESLEEGLCCHDKVPDRERAVALLCDPFTGSADFSGEGGSGRDGDRASPTPPEDLGKSMIV